MGIGVGLFSLTPMMKGNQYKKIRISLVFAAFAIFLIAGTYYGTKTLSGVRASITAEGLWTKAQKGATQDLLEYTLTKDENSYNLFQEKVELNHNFSKARKALISAHPKKEIARQGFQASDLSSNDIELMIWLAVHFKELPYMSQALDIWKQGDRQIARLDRIARQVHQAVITGQLTVEDQQRFRQSINQIDDRLTTLENAFSATLSEGSHWVRNLIFWITVSLGGLLTFVGYLITNSHFKEISNLNAELEHLSLVAAKTTDIVIITDQNECITWVNKTFERITGYNFEEVKGSIPGDFLQCPETDPETVARIEKAITNRETSHERILNCTKGGERYWLDMKIDPIFDNEGQCTHFIAIERDITEKVRQEAEVEESLQRYRIVSRATSDTIWELDLQKDVIRYNDVIYDMFGYKQTEVSNTSEWWWDKIHPGDRQRVIDKFENGLQQERDRIQFEYRFKCSDGTYKYILDRAFIVKDHEGNPVRAIGAMQDITEHKETQLEIAEALKEKEALLAEVHHRVKNNMAVVSGIMELQAFEEENPTIRKKLLANVARIGTIATIHEHLYQSDNLSSLNFSENIENLIHKLTKTIKHPANVTVDMNLSQTIWLNVNQAIPCSLIICEVITNALKHAFTGSEPGRLEVGLCQKNKQIILSVKDNGRGLPHVDISGNNGSLGFHLIAKLAKQLDAEYQFHPSERGTYFELQFEKLEVKGSASAYLN